MSDFGRSPTFSGFGSIFSGPILAENIGCVADNKNKTVKRVLLKEIIMQNIPRKLFFFYITYALKSIFYSYLWGWSTFSLYLIKVGAPKASSGIKETRSLCV